MRKILLIVTKSLLIKRTPVMTRPTAPKVVSPAACWLNSRKCSMITSEYCSGIKLVRMRVSSASRSLENAGNAAKIAREIASKGTIPRRVAKVIVEAVSESRISKRRSTKNCKSSRAKFRNPFVRIFSRNFSVVASSWRTFLPVAINRNLEGYELE